MKNIEKQYCALNFSREDTRKGRRQKGGRNEGKYNGKYKIEVV